MLINGQNTRSGRKPTSSVMLTLARVAHAICVVILGASGMNLPFKRKKLVNVRSFVRKVDYILDRAN
jgi:hypothetical protein